jgi:hypothetical protein
MREVGEWVQKGGEAGAAAPGGAAEKWAELGSFLKIGERLGFLGFRAGNGFVSQFWGGRRGGW